MASKFFKVLCVFLSVVMVFSSTSVIYAKSKKEQINVINERIEKKEKELKNLKNKKSDLNKYVDTLQSKITLYQDKIDKLESNKASLQKDIDAVSAKMKKTEAEIAKTQKDIDAKQAEFKEIYDVYCQRLRAMYISGNVSTLEVLLESEDMSSVLTRAEMVRSIAKQDSKTLDELMTKMEEIEKQKQVLENKKADLNNDKTKLDSQKSELQASIKEISSSKSELNAEVSECNASIKELSKTSNEILEGIETDKNKVDRLEDEIRQASMSKPSHNGSSGGSYTPGTGSLGYPTSYRTISAGYPNYKSGRYHGGVDFPCPTGTPVHAADSGQVVLVKHLNYSYGNYVLINHGNGLSTLYAHNSQVLVHQGQNVKKGQLIAKSGATGNATGPHCHFEVRLNGNRVNPMNYLH